MRLLHSVRATFSQTKKPQRKFIAHLLELFIMLPGHATFRNLSRSSSSHEKTFARWYERPFNWVSCNKAAITAVMPPEHEQALAIDASCVPKSGKQTYGLARFWNGCQSRAEKGLERSTVAWLDITGNWAYSLRVVQTPPRAEHAEPDATRIDAYWEQLRRVVTTHELRPLCYLITDGAYRTQKFVTGVCDLGWHQIGQLRADANLRYLYRGPQRPGRGRHKTYDGTVNWRDLSRFEHLETEDEGIVLYQQVVTHVNLQRNLQVVVVVNTQANRSVVLLSTDGALETLTLYRFDKARFQIECCSAIANNLLA